MSEIASQIRDHYITFKDHVITDERGRPMMRTVYMTREDFSPIQSAIDAGRSDIYIRCLNRNIPKRNYEEAGVVTDSQLRDMANKQKKAQYHVVCHRCGLNLPPDDFFQEHTFRFCEDSRK